MTKKLKNKLGTPPDKAVEREIKAGPDSEEYIKYLEEHKKKLRRLDREAKGLNLEEPEY